MTELTKEQQEQYQKVREKIAEKVKAIEGKQHFGYSHYEFTDQILSHPDIFIKEREQLKADGWVRFLPKEVI